jgi:hypothetical protein
MIARGNVLRTPSEKRFASSYHDRLLVILSPIQSEIAMMRVRGDRHRLQSGGYRANASRARMQATFDIGGHV